MFLENDNMKLMFSKQCIKVEKRIKVILGYIRRQFKYWDKQKVLTLCITLVRILLKNAVEFQS